MKAGVVVVTHGQLAAELLNAAEMIVGDLPHFAAVSIGWHDDVAMAKEEIGRAIERVRQKVATPDRPGGVLMLTDAHTYHGFKKMSLPPGVTRKSIATYAYEVIPEGSVTARTTGWAPEQGNAFKRTIVRGITTPWSRPRPESSAARQPRIVSLKPSAAKGLRPRDADSADDSPAHPVDNGQVLTGGFIS